jgi:hypothetical protein
MKCERCNGLDFDVVIPNLLGHAYLECSNCKQGFIVLEKLKLRYAELIGDVRLNTDDCIVFTCGVCKAFRLVEHSQGHLVKSTQVCNRCIADTPNDGSTVEKGEKITWEEFTSKAKSFE